MSLQTATKRQSQKNFNEAVRESRKYHTEHYPIRPGSKEESECRRLWSVAREKYNKMITSN